MTEFVETFGTKEEADKVIVCWEDKKEGAEGYGMTFFKSTEPIPFDLKGEDIKKYIDEDGLALTLFFGAKNGKKSLRNIIKNLRAMLREMEAEHGDE